MKPTALVSAVISTGLLAGAVTTEQKNGCTENNRMACMDANCNLAGVPVRRVSDDDELFSGGEALLAPPRATWNAGFLCGGGSVQPMEVTANG